ncbi:MAG: DNA methyltransferase, partial [Halothiobacillaceae bacterium]
VHGTQKPVECMRRPILNNSSPGQAVYEPFMGSGTTLIAAETTGRICFGVELNPAYVDVAIERWQAFTGQEAVLMPTGQRFAEVKVSRTGG